MKVLEDYRTATGNFRNGNLLTGYHDAEIRDRYDMGEQIDIIGDWYAVSRSTIYRSLRRTE